MSKRKDHVDRYLQVHHYMTRTEAWRALSTQARAVYIQLGTRYLGENNGSLAFSVRDAANECKLAKDTAARAFKELITLGFIEETRHGGIRRKTRLASEWRLTAFYCNLTKTPKSCLFMHRRAEARDNRQASLRPQSTVLNDGLPCPKRRSRVSQKTVHPVLNDGTGNPPTVLNDGTDEAVLGGPPVLNDGTHIIYHPLSDADEGKRTAHADEPTPVAVALATWVKRGTGRAVFAPSPSNGSSEVKRVTRGRKPCH